MFGNKTPFGTTSTFGANTFGATASPFGQSTSTFSANKPLGGGFTTQPFGATTTGTSLFGSTSSAPSLFGNTTNTFGQNAPAANSSFVFGGTPAPTTGIFGVNTQPTVSTGLFSSPGTSAFGTPKSTFGNTGGFGSTASTTLFGQNQPQPTTSIFGQSTTTTPGLFGTTSFGVSSVGTSGTTVKFNAVSGTDTMLKNGVSTNIGTRHQCITVMKEYENKSLEELRVEDYLANRKGMQQSGLTVFGTAPQQPGIFGTGSSATPAFFNQPEQNKTTMFGGATGGTTTFGSSAPASSLFGQQAQPQMSSPFAKPLSFGGTATTQSSTNFFGSPSFTGVAQPNKPTLFGTGTLQPAGAGVFGAAAPTQQTTTFGSGTAFGTSFGQSTAGTGLFGAKTTGFTTATTSAPPFGQTNTNTGSSLFAQKPSTSVFGAAAPFGQFGTPNTSTSIFSQAKPNVGFTSFNTGLGGGQNTGFGGMNIFGNQTTQPGSLGLGTGMNNSLGFGMGSGLGVGTLPGFNSGSINPGSDPNAAQQQAQANQQLLLLATSPFGDSPLFRNMLHDTGKREELLKPTNPQAQKLVGNTTQYKVSPRVTGRVKPTPMRVSMSTKSALFNDLEDDDSSGASETLVPRPSIKRLILKRRSRLNTQGSDVADGHYVTDTPPIHAVTSTAVFSPRTPNSSRDASTSTHQTEDLKTSDVIHGKLYPDLKNVARNLNNRDLDDTVSALNLRRYQRELQVAEDEENDVGRHSSLEATLNDSSVLEQEQDSGENDPHPTGIVLKRIGYYTIPSMEELAGMVEEDGSCFVENFTIGREDYGNVCFPGITNVAGLNLDEIVHFRRKEVTLYPDDDQKPPVGQGLNKKAQITLDRVWPNDKTTHFPIKDLDRLKMMNYQQRLENVAAKLGARFMDYRPETGSWVFQVSHFSKYGLEDSDEDDNSVEPDAGVTIPVPPLAQQTQQPKKATIISEMLSERRMNGHSIPFSSIHQDEDPSLPLRLRDDDDDMEDVTTDLYSDGNTFWKRSEYDADLYDEEDMPLREVSHQALGVNCERLQVMKAAFLQDNEDDEQDEDVGPRGSIQRMNDTRVKSFMAKNDVRSSPMQNDLFKNRMNVTNEGTLYMESNKRPKVMDEHHSRLFPAVKDHMISDLPSNYVSLSAAEAHLLARMQPVVIPEQCKGLLPLSKSLLSNKQRLIADTACFMGRSFRVGWGPNHTIVHLGQSLGQYKLHESEDSPGLLSKSWAARTPYEQTPFSTVTMETVITPSCLAARDAMCLANVERNLELELEHTRLACESGNPIAVPNPGVESLPIFAELSSKQRNECAMTHTDSDFLKQCHIVWGLIVSLWGKLEEDEGDAYELHMARRHSLSNWLASACSQTVDVERKSFKQDDDGYLSMIFSYLSGHQINQAVLVARDAFDHHLELILAQGGSNVLVRKVVSQQLEQWRTTQTDKFIAAKRMKIYTLLAGIPVWSTSDSCVNICEDLDWKRAIAVHLWYLCLPMASIEDILKDYCTAFKGSLYGCYAARPVPPYVETASFGAMEEDEASDAEGMEDMGQKFVPRDMCYHLLKLYNKKSHRLDRLLTPTTSTRDNLDYRLSWHVQQALCRIGYSHLSEQKTCTLHCDFAVQLENAGLWTWAIFVLLHIADATRRKALVMDVLCRNIQVKSDGKVETFLSQKLLIPTEWLYEAKALRARHSGDDHEEAWYLLKAGHWYTSHSLLIRRIAPDAIINENYDYLKNFLEEFCLPDRVSTISNWGTGGQVFLDYIHLSQTVEKIIEGELNAYELERLQPEVTSLCKRVKNVICLTAKDRLCVSEMAKKTANLLKVVISLQTGTADMDCRTAPLPTRILASHISNLPLPEDYFMQELQALTHSYALEVTQ